MLSIGNMILWHRAVPIERAPQTGEDAQAYRRCVWGTWSKVAFVIDADYGILQDFIPRNIELLNRRQNATWPQFINIPPGLKKESG